MPKYKSENNTNISLTYCFNELLKLIPSFSKTEFAKFLNTTRQNLGQRLLRNSKLTESERISLKNILIEKNIPTKFLSTPYILGDVALVPVRSEVELSCGSGIISNADFISDTIGLDVNFIKLYGGNPQSISVVFAKGDSMNDIISQDDALLIDESKNQIINNKVYAFVYDAELYCKVLKKTYSSICAISYNKSYKPFFIDKNKQFEIIGQVISVIKRV